MARTQTIYRCEECGAQALKWAGRCCACGAWNCLSEVAIARDTPRGAGVGSLEAPISIVEVRSASAPARPTGLNEVDRVLGGGLTDGSVTLIGGQPGIGKSTLLTQVVGSMAEGGHRVLYVSGEESSGQVQARAERLNCLHEHLYLLPTSDVTAVGAACIQLDPTVVVVDSVQTLSDPSVSSAPGSVAQVVAVASAMLEIAKASSTSQTGRSQSGRSQSGRSQAARPPAANSNALDSPAPVVDASTGRQHLTTATQGISPQRSALAQGPTDESPGYEDGDLAGRCSGPAVLLVGHLTKEGGLAGPKALEHLVDTVISFEGDRQHSLRMLRATKHRFGATGEVGLFSMGSCGLTGLEDASGEFLADRRPGVPGSAVVPLLDGQRPMLVEVQALVAESVGTPSKRSVQGVPPSRVDLLMAVLGRRVGLFAKPVDVFVAAMGGLTVREPAADLGIAMALASSTTGSPLPADLLCLAEIGLGGELRQAPGMQTRLREAARLGFRTALVPNSCELRVPGIELLRVPTLSAAVAQMDGVLEPGPRRVVPLGSPPGAADRSLGTRSA